MLERFVAAVGGRAALERIAVRHYRGTIVLELSWKEPPREGRRVILLTPASLPGAHDTLYFDEESGLLNHVGYHNDLRGWREVDGVLFPERWVFGRQGGHTTYLFEEVGAGPAPTDP